MWLILMAWVVVYVDITNPELKRRFYIVSIAEVILLALIYICPKLLARAEKINIPNEPEALTEKQKLKFIFKSWLICFVFFFVMYIIFYPGGFNPDNLGQYVQAVNGNYSDHHPVLQTLFAYTLPLKLTGGWPGSINLFQLAVFSLVIAYMVKVLLEYSSRRYAKISLAYILLNPASFSMAITPLKDTSFALAVLLSMVFALRIYFTKGEWLRNIRHLLMFVIVLAAGTIFRHNAILFTLPLLFAVSMYTDKKHAAILFICFMGLLYIVRGPLYDNMNVSRPTGNRQIETLGLPMTVIGNAVKETYGQLDKDILDFACSVAPLEVWEKYFNAQQGFDSIKTVTYGKKGKDLEDAIKASKQIDIYAIERAGWKKILMLTLKCFREAPVPAMRGALSVTTICYGIAGMPGYISSPAVDANSLGLRNRTTKLFPMTGTIRKVIPQVGGISIFMESDYFTLQALIVILKYIITVLFKHIFWHIGVLNLAVIIFCLAKLNFGRLSDWKRMFLVLPMLAYNFGTMLLLSSILSRVFYYSFLVFPVILLVLLKTNDEVKL